MSGLSYPCSCNPTPKGTEVLRAFPWRRGRLHGPGQCGGPGAREHLAAALQHLALGRRSRAGARLVSAARELLGHFIWDLATLEQFLEEVAATCGLDTGRSLFPQLGGLVRTVLATVLGQGPSPRRLGALVHSVGSQAGWGARLQQAYGGGQGGAGFSTLPSCSSILTSPPVGPTAGTLCHRCRRCCNSRASTLASCRAPGHPHPPTSRLCTTCWQRPCLRQCNSGP